MYFDAVLRNGSPYAWALTTVNDATLNTIWLRGNQIQTLQCDAATRVFQPLANCQSLAYTYVNSYLRISLSYDDAVFAIPNGISFVKLRPTVTFVRTGQMSAHINVIVQYRVSTDGTNWSTAQSYTVSLNPNADRQAVTFPAYTRSGNGVYLSIGIVVEHAYAGEGVAIDNNGTFIEISAY